MVIFETWGFEAKAKDFKMCPWGQGRPRGLHLCLLFSLFGQLAFAAQVKIFLSHCKHQHGFLFSQRNQLGWQARVRWQWYQRWSRGHKARGQGHKKNPRPRTAFPRTDPLEAKDRNARGQGQGPKTQLQAFPPKKRSLKKFFRQSPIYRRSQNFWLGRPKPQTTCNDVIKNLPVGT